MGDKTSDKRLLPCPFCGGKAEVNLMLGNYCVTCTECMGGVFPARGMTKEEAIQAWNTRKPVDAVLEHLEEELNFADIEMKRCAQENPLQFDSAKGYADGLYVAIMKIKEMLT